MLIYSQQGIYFVLKNKKIGISHILGEANICKNNYYMIRVLKMLIYSQQSIFVNLFIISIIIKLFLLFTCAYDKNIFITPFMIKIFLLL